MLQGEEEDDLTEARKLLDVLSPGLLDKLHVRECVDILYERQIISESDKEEIEAKEKHQGPIAATKVLLNKLPRKNHRWAVEFSKKLENQGLSGIATMFLRSNDSGNIQARLDYQITTSAQSIYSLGCT